MLVSIFRELRHRRSGETTPIWPSCLTYRHGLPFASPLLADGGTGHTVSPEGGADMRFHLWTSAGPSVLGCALLVATSLAAAGPKEDVGAATMKWAQTLGQNDPDKVVALYASDGVLWGTLSPTVRADRAALRDYFVTAFRVLPNLKVTFGQQLIRVYGDTAVNTGYYTFSYVKDGETKTLPARYSFTFVKDGENWMIVDHHSSAMPAPPR